MNIILGKVEFKSIKYNRYKSPGVYVTESDISVVESNSDWTLTTECQTPINFRVSSDGHRRVFTIPVDGIDDAEITNVINNFKRQYLEDDAISTDYFFPTR